MQESIHELYNNWNRKNCVDLYIKCLKSKNFKKIFIFNQDKNSEGANIV